MLPDTMPGNAKLQGRKGTCGRWRSPSTIHVDLQHTLVEINMHIDLQVCAYIKL